MAGYQSLLGFWMPWGVGGIGGLNNFVITVTGLNMNPVIIASGLQMGGTVTVSGVNMHPTITITGTI